MNIIGIDPGENTGIARYKDGKLVGLGTYKPMALIHYLYGAALGIQAVVIEDSRKQSVVFRRKDKDGKPVKPSVLLKIARDVGRIDMQCEIIEDACQSNGIKFYGLSPLEKGAKLDEKLFNAMTGWKGESNEHNRDAAMVVHSWLSTQRFNQRINKQIGVKND